MAEPWEVEVNGQIYEVKADTPQQAATLARLYAAREQGVGQATAGATARNPQPSPSEQMTERMQALKTVNPQRERDLEMMMRSKEPGAAGAALGLTGTVPLIGGLITAPAVTAAGLAGGYAGSEVGQRGGRQLEEFGAPAGTSKVLGLVGGLGGGIYGAVKGQSVLNGLLRAGVGRGSPMGQLLERMVGAEAGAGGSVAGVSTEEAAKRTALTLEKQQADIAAKQALAEARKAQAARIAAKEARDAERHELQKQLLQRRLEGKAASTTVQPKTQPPTAPEPIPATKGSTAAELNPDQTQPVILPAGQRAMATNLGGKAKPGPVATPEVDLEEVLRRSIEAAKAAKAAKAAGSTSPLRQPRLEVGAEKVGKGVGLSKEEVRVQTGPRLDEALGEASPILPDVPFKKIVDTLKALPKTGGFREEYVARATSGKTMAQVENIRRTLEHLGLLAPVAVAGGMAAER